MKALLAKVKKALWAGGIAGAGVLVTAWPDGITADEWGKVAGAAVAAAAVVFGVKNAPWKAPAE